MWKPWTEAQIATVVAGESARLDETERRKLRRFRQRASLVGWPRLASVGDHRVDGDSTWVIARSRQQVLFFDSVEEEFGVGQLTESGQLTDYEICGEKLAWALRRFAETD